MTSSSAELADLAVAALGEITDPATVGPLVDATEREPGVVDLEFACLLPGYPDWRWTVSTARLDDAAPTVLEVELLPGDGSLLAPPWVPWTERLAEYRRTHADEDPAGADGGDLDDELDDADDELDGEELDEDGAPDDESDDDESDDDESDDDDELDEDENGDLDADDDDDDGLDDVDDELDGDEIDDDVDDELDDGVDVEAAAEAEGR